MKSLKRRKKFLQRFTAFALAVIMLVGIIPIGAVTAEAATTKTVSMSSLGRVGDVAIGSKTKSGTWWQMDIGGKTAFCIDLGYACHSGNSYAVTESHKWDQDTKGKNGCYAKVIRWYVVKKKRSTKAFIVSQALIWSIAEDSYSEANLKEVIKQVRKHVSISTDKSDNEIYKEIFEPEGAWTSEITFWQKTGNSSYYQRLLTVDAEEEVRTFTPSVASDSTYYRQRITVDKKDEDGKGLGGIKFTLSAHNLDDLYSFSMTDRDGTESDTADDDNDTSFSLTGYTKGNGRIAYRMTYKLVTKKYYYYPDSKLDIMTADEKKAAKKLLTDELELDEGKDFGADMTKTSAQKLMNQEMKEMKEDISNTYTLKEESTGDNKDIIMDKEFAKGVKITLKKANSWEKNSDGKWPDSLAENAAEYSKAYNAGVTNNYKKATIEVVKTDKYSADKKPHGDASLDGAEFQLYAEAACSSKATVYDAKGKAKTAGTYTVKNGKLTTDYLRSGTTYYLKETKAPTGYTLSATVLPVKADASKVTAEYTPNIATAEFGNTPVLGKVAVKKCYFENKPGPFLPEPGTSFEVFLTRKGSYAACDQYERAVIKTDANGYGVSGNLYYGTYTVRQKDSGTIDALFVDDFQVKVTKNGEVYTYPLNNQLFKAFLKIIKKDGNTEKTVLKAGTTYQIYRVNGGKEELVEQTYTDGEGEKKASQFVTDESGEIMTVDGLLSGVYRIYETDSASGLHVTEKYIEVTVNSRADNYESYRDEDGYLHATITLTYTNEETYGKLKLYKTGEMLTGFEDGNFVYESRFLKGAVFEIHAAEDIVTQDGQGTNWFDKDELVAAVTTGEGAEFTKECRKITGFSIDDDGTVTVSLPLGKYRVMEKKSLYGYVLPENGWDVEFNWKNYEEEFVLNATDATDENGVLHVENRRAKAEVLLVKADAADGKAVEGAEFGIFSKDDIYNVDGEKIVDAGTMIGTVTTDAEGKAVSGLDFPLMGEGYGAASGSAIEGDGTEVTGPPLAPPTGVTPAAIMVTAEGITAATPSGAATAGAVSGGAAMGETPKNSGDYYFKELSVSGSYYLNETEYPVHLEFADDATATIEARVEADNTQTSVVIRKKSIVDGKELDGCGLQITDPEGNVIVEWISGDRGSVKLNEGLAAMGYRNAAAETDTDGNLAIRGLLHDTAYTLTETSPADGFVTADKIHFQLIEGEEYRTVAAIQKDGEWETQDGNVVTMTDDTVKIEISKTGTGGTKEIPGCEMEITEKDTGKVVDTWTTTEEKHLVEQKFTVGKVYVLTEKKAADGYATADSIEFTVRDTGDIQAVRMEDDTTKIRVLKLAGDTGQGIRGAKFEVYDEEGNLVMEFRSKEDGYDITGKLAAGRTYTFKETEAPKGYKLADPVKYTVKDTGKVQEVSITDEKIPDTHRIPQTGDGTNPGRMLVIVPLLALGAAYMLRRRKSRRR